MRRFLGNVGFGRRPVVAAILATAAFVGWIVGGTLLLDLADWFSATDTRRFVRDGLVRWPLAAVLLAAGLVAARGWPVSTFGPPRRPDRFPWATVGLGVGAMVLALPLTQFWSHGRYTLSVLFSEFGTGVVEEVGFRGVLFCGLLAGLGRSRRAVRAAAELTCVLFGLAHVASGPAAVLVTAVLGGLFLACTLEMRSLWPAAILHGLLDVGVNGRAASPVDIADEWAEPVLVVGDMTLLVGSLASLVALVVWRWWPADEPDGAE